MDKLIRIPSDRPDEGDGFCYVMEEQPKAEAKGKKDDKTPTKQGDYEVGNKRPPKNRQFGQPGGNPRHNGAWKKEDTARYKLQQMIKMSDEELRNVAEDKNEAKFVQTFARAIHKGDVETALKILNQVEGMPKQHIDANVEMPKPLVDLTGTE